MSPAGPSADDVSPDADARSGARAYLAAAGRAIARVAAQVDEIERAAGHVADALGNGRRVFAFGTGHSHLLAEELYTRAGGLRGIEAVLEPSLMLHEGAAKSSALEKLTGYARILVANAGVGEGDVVVVASSSGRNAVPVEFAEESKARGATVIAVTSREHSGSVDSRAPSGRRLMEVADVVLDNTAPLGDATVSLPDRSEKVGPVSTVAGSVLLQSIVCEAALRLARNGRDPGVLVSYNVDPQPAT